MAAVPSDQLKHVSTGCTQHLHVLYCSEASHLASVYHSSKSHVDEAVAAAVRQFFASSNQTVKQH